ncbi:hypothetical protein [Chelativorans intermedius]|uniref:Uncharacterized protein n=1 Tax=Chelativorans intermedius TaxID=515947 RepID=A0ABV6DB98_9HYPH|nr:hypothetical protein [Chelativorans intermedius]MCT9000228.1 hypothetical protein [Chelativorans intermedius]
MDFMILRAEFELGWLASQQPEFGGQNMPLRWATPCSSLRPFFVCSSVSPKLAPNDPHDTTCKLAPRGSRDLDLFGSHRTSEYCRDF